MQRFLKNVDFYRKVPADLTKSTTTGACMSICGVFVLLFLFLSELSSFMTVNDRFEIAMNDDSVLDTALQINFSTPLIVSYGSVPLSFTTTKSPRYHPFGTGHPDPALLVMPSVNYRRRARIRAEGSADM